MALERNDIPCNIHIIQFFEFTDPHAVRFPDLGIDGPCLILERKALVVFSVLRDQSNPFLAKINVLYTAALA